MKTETRKQLLEYFNSITNDKVILRIEILNGMNNY